LLIVTNWEQDVPCFRTWRNQFGAGHTSYFAMRKITCVEGGVICSPDINQTASIPNVILACHHNIKPAGRHLCLRVSMPDFLYASHATGLFDIDTI
jgi:hypothetical protein